MSKYEMCAGNTKLFIRDTDGDWHQVNNAALVSHDYDFFSDWSTFKVRVLGNPLSGPMALPSADSKRKKYLTRLPKHVTVNGDVVTCVWQDGTHTITRCHEEDEFDLDAAILVCAIKKWLPGGTYWYHASEDVRVDDVQKRRKKKSQPGTETVGHATIERRPCRPYMRGGKYGDDEKLKVIEAIEGGMSQADASRKFGISQGTISKWMAAWRSGNDGE